MLNDWPSTSADEIRARYAAARAAYAALNVDTEAAIAKAADVPVSIHCWQADDVTGLEARQGATDGGGLLATGNYPGRARNGDQMRQDFQQVLALAPGTHRINLHASYAETDGRPVDRDELEPEHFGRWIAWAKERRIGLDFNSTFFAHPKAAGGRTLSHADPEIRQFWIRHGIASRRIAEAMARRLSTPCVNNFWLPDGMKDSPADRWGPRERLKESLDLIFAASMDINRRLCIDAVEGKLFGLGSEDFVVGSYDFYAAYALSQHLTLCLDMGHFHPTEGVHDKLSALLQFNEHLLLHVSRGIRWDSDHVAIFNDDLRAVFLELARGGALDRVFVALDYFDASINRIAAYVIGARATRKAILFGLLDPSAALKELETAGRGAQKLALMEEMKTMPFGAVWDKLCLEAAAPVGPAWLAEVEAYERDVLAKRV
jgi:L-rhamnose isomerase